MVSSSLQILLLSRLLPANAAVMQKQWGSWLRKKHARQQRSRGKLKPGPYSINLPVTEN